MPIDLKKKIDKRKDKYYNFTLRVSLERDIYKSLC